jgi:hypothetical protein
MVDDPTVVAVAGIWDSGRHPRLTRRSGIPIVSYCRTRVYLDRDAWEMLPANGVLLMRVQPTDGTRYALAFTADELEKVFGEVRATASWRDARCYHFPSEPPAARAFLVNIDGSRNDPAAPTLSRPTSPAPQQTPTPAPRPTATPPSSSPTIMVDPHQDEPTDAFHAWAEAWYARLGVRPESAQYLDAVIAWRNAWRPPRARIVLLAESHVGEHPGDAPARVKAKNWATRPLPDQYVRLIYCLGYGESDICTGRPRSNSGTPQFWNIFGQVALGQSPPRKTESSLRQRLRWKVRVLEQLSQRGIWLQDASPLGIYLV